MFGRPGFARVLTLMVHICAAAAIAAPPGVTQLGFVGNSTAPEVTVFNTVTSATGAVTVGGGANNRFGVAITPDGRTAVVTNFGAGTLTTVDVLTGVAGTPVAVGTATVGVAITPDGTTAFVANAGTGNLTRVDLATSAVTQIPTGGSTPVNVAITPDGTTAYVTLLGSNAVVPVDVATSAVGAQIPTGGSMPNGIVISPDGATAYVVNGASGTVTPIDIGTNTAGAPINVGTAVGSLVITPDGTTLYVVTSTTTVVPVAVAGPLGVVGTPIVVPDGVQALAISPDGQTVFATAGATSMNSSVTPITVGTNTVGTPFNAGTGPSGIAVGPSLITGVASAGSDADLTALGAIPQYASNVNLAGGTLTATGSFATNKPVVLWPAINITGVLVSAAGGTVNTNGFDVTLDGVVSGVGGFNKTGAGTLTLTALNTYDGGTVVTGGLVNFNQVGNFGTGNITLDAGGLQWATGTSTDISARLNAIGAGGTTFDTNGNDVTLASALTGAGAVTKVGAGTLTLAGTNTFTGATTIDAGTLAVSNGQAIADTSAVLVNAGGTLALNDSETIASLAGAGAVDLGDSTLTAGGNNASTTYSGSMSGTGGFTKVGTGRTTFTGVSSYSGLTSVNEGIFTNNGALTASTVDVGTAARFEGTGSVANAVIRGTVAPGNSIGTMTVDQNISFDPTGTFEVETNADGRSDRIVAGGVGTLGSAAVRVLPETGTYQFRTNYTILSAAGGLAGTFGSATSSDAMFRAAVTNQGNDVILSLERTDFTLRNSALTVNQRNAALAIDQVIARNEVPLFSDLELVLNTASLFNAAQQQLFLSQITPEVQAQATSAVLMANTAFLNTVFIRQGSLRARKAAERERRRNTDANQTSAPAASASKTAALTGAGGATSGMLTPTTAAVSGHTTGRDPGHDSEAEVWALGFDLQGSLDADGNVSRSSFDSDGFNVGVGKQVTDDWLVGFNIGNGDTRVGRGGTADQVRVDGNNFGAYASYDRNRWSLDMAAGLIDLGFRSSRQIAVGGLNRVAAAGYSGDELYGAAELGYEATDGKLKVRPTLALIARHLEQDSFTETGAGALNLAVAGRELDSLQSGLGVRISRRFSGSGRGWWEPELKLRWQHEFEDTDRSLTSSFAGTTPSFVTLGRTIAEDVYQSRVGITGATSGGLEMNASYFREDASDQKLDGLVGYATYRF